MRNGLSVVVVVVLAIQTIVAHPAAAQPTLGIRADKFTVNGTPKFLTFVSYFDAMRRVGAPGGIDNDFKYLKSIGIDGIRIFPNWPVYYDPNPQPPQEHQCSTDLSIDTHKLFTAAGAINESGSPNMWSAFLAILNAAATNGLLVDVSFTRETYTSPPSVSAYQAAIVTVATRLAQGTGYRHVLFDIQNEYDLDLIPNQSEPNRLTNGEANAIIAAIDAVDAQRIVTVSGAATTIPAPPTISVDAVAYHDDRQNPPNRPDRWYWASLTTERLDTIRAMLTTFVKPVMFQEPMPFNSFGTCTQTEDSAQGHHRMAAIHAMAAGAASWTFHTRQSFVLSSQSLSQILAGDAAQAAELAGLRPAIESFQRIPSNADWDGDGKADIAVFTPRTAQWTVRRSTNGQLLSFGANPGADVFGSVELADLPVPGNYWFDNDGLADRAICRLNFATNSIEWYVVWSAGGGSTVPWGNVGDRCVPADYDGDSKTDVAVYRQADGTWHIIKSSGGSTQLQWGSPGDVPVPADYDGDNKADIAIYRTGTGEWFILRSTNSTLLYVGWGAPALGDVPVPANYDGDTRDDIAVYRTSASQWFIINSSGGSQNPVFGATPTLGDVPVPANYLSATQATIAVRRPGDRTWYIPNAPPPSVTLGVATDILLP